MVFVINHVHCIVLMMKTGHHLMGRNGKLAGPHLILLGPWVQNWLGPLQM